ncbi:hypothetical protein E2C01_026576 [Portunus trituberculatus]|uniref:Uncharacterized protein n=1 Tax=Portunus trituberculatus TaxID=210409 RepID=A0A5B7EGG5_PORTR|nr:hypothetical protein [Portunus trituberculatus]
MVVRNPEKQRDFPTTVCLHTGILEANFHKRKRDDGRQDTIQGTTWGGRGERKGTVITQHRDSLWGAEAAWGSMWRVCVEAGRGGKLFKVGEWREGMCRVTTTTAGQHYSTNRSTTDSAGGRGHLGNTWVPRTHLDTSGSSPSSARRVPGKLLLRSEVWVPSKCGCGAACHARNDYCTLTKTTMMTTRRPLQGRIRKKFRYHAHEESKIDSTYQSHKTDGKFQEQK